MTRVRVSVTALKCGGEMMPSDLTTLREAWQDDLCGTWARRVNCGCPQCLDDLLRRGVAHGIELAMAEVRRCDPEGWPINPFNLRISRNDVLARLAALKGGA